MDKIVKIGTKDEFCLIKLEVITLLMMTRKKCVRRKELKVHLQNQVQCVQEELYKPKGKKKV